jgi:hypothetical protein
MIKPLAGFILGAGLLAMPTVLASQDSTPAIHIRLASNSGLEGKGRDQLRRLLATYDLHRWIFTDTVQIQSRVIPHRHPVLTLNTRYLDNDTAQVATFLHEQLHWFLVERDSAVDRAVVDLRRLYPRVPSGPPEGARDEESTYLHLLVCMLEFEAVRETFNENVARRILGSWRHYTWVYREVLDRPAPLVMILRAHALQVP